MFQDVLVDRPRANLHGQPSFYISFILCAYTSEEKKGFDSSLVLAL